MEDTQAGLFLASISLACRTAYFERNVALDAGKEAWQQADILSLWAVECIMEIPGSANFHAFAASNFFTGLLTLPSHRRYTCRTGPEA